MFRLNYDNVAERIKEIDEAISENVQDLDICNRLLAIKMYLQDEKHPQISKITGISQTTLKHLISFYHHGGIKPIIDYHSRKSLNEEQKEQIIRLINKGMTQSEIALQVGCSVNTVANYKNYNPKIEKQNTKSQNEVKNNMTIEEIEKKIVEQENTLQELKKNLKRQKKTKIKFPMM